MLSLQDHTENTVPTAAQDKRQIIALCEQLVNSQRATLAQTGNLFTQLNTVLLRQSRHSIDDLLGSEPFTALHKTLWHVRSAYEGKNEKRLAEQMLALDKPVYECGLNAKDWYAATHNFEINALAKYRPQSLLFAGAGALPTSAIAFAVAFPEAEIVALDHSRQACELAQRVATKLGVDNLRTQHADIRDIYDFSAYDCVINAVLLGITPDEKKNLCAHLLEHIPEHTLLAIRIAFAHGRVFYPGLEAQDLQSLQLHRLRPPTDLVCTLAVNRNSI